MLFRRFACQARFLAIVLCLASTQAWSVAPTWVPESGNIDRATAQALAFELIHDVETQALRPRVQEEYDIAKAHLLALIDGPAAVESRAAVYGAARRMLSTLDTDGHTLLWSREQTATWQNATQPEAARDSSSVRIVDGQNGRAVLVLHPPQTTFMDTASARTYALTLIDRIHQQMATADPCAVVVDLSDSQGGSAWPALAALAPLISDTNQARFVDRDGKRRPMMAPGVDAWAAGGPLPANDLARLTGHPIAIVLAPDTASAGEMIAIALRGEPSSRSFGRATYGATTGNLPTQLPDGAMVLLTTARYAWGDAPALRGPLRPDEPADPADSVATTLSKAVDWSSAQCHRKN